MQHRDHRFDPYALDRPVVVVSQEQTDLDPASEAILQLGRLAASRVNSRTVSLFRDRLLDRRGQYPPSSVFIEEWLRIVEDGEDAIRTALGDPSDRGRMLRTVAPLRAFVSDTERKRLIRETLQSRPFTWS